MPPSHVAELRYGIACLPAGKRRDNLRERIESTLLPQFTGRIMPFDFAVSQTYADALVKANKAGFCVGVADGYIVAPALSHGLAVATRDGTGAPFKAMCATVINPWKM